MTSRRSLLAAGLLTLAVSWSGTGVGAAGGAPDIFDVAADGTPVLSQGVIPAVVPTVLATGMARSSVTINSQPRAQSQAAVVYSPAAESSQTLGLPAVPAEAQPWCYSYFPVEPRETSCGGPGGDYGPFKAAGGRGHTSTEGDPADPSSPRSEASTLAVGVAVTGLGPAVAVSTVVSSAAAGRDGAGMSGIATTGIDDLLVADVLQVRSIRSRVAGALGGTPGSGVAEREFVITGAEVGAIPVTIDEKGVHAPSQGSSPVFGELQTQVNKALADTGVEVRTVPAAEPTMAADGTSLQISSGGLLLTFTRSEATASLLLGQSNLQMAASRQQPTLPAELAAPASEAVIEPTPVPAPSPAPVGLPPAPAPNETPTGFAAPAASAAGPTVPSSSRAAAVTRPPSPAQPTAPPSAATWRIPYGPFGVLVLSIPVLAHARRLTLIPGGPR